MEKSERGRWIYEGADGKMLREKLKMAKLIGKEARDPSGGKQGTEEGAGWGWGV